MLALWTASVAHVNALLEACLNLFCPMSNIVRSHYLIHLPSHRTDFSDVGNILG